MSSSTGWIKSVTLQASEHRLIAGGFLLAALIVIALWLQSIIGWAFGKGPPGFSWAFYGGLAGWGATTLGALPALFLRRMPQKVEDSLLGAYPAQTGHLAHTKPISDSTANWTASPAQPDHLGA
jgi:zinc transporter, ZIP family